MDQDLGHERLGVMDALGRGWELLMGDFWPLWTVGLVLFALMAVSGVPGAIPYIGGCISLVISIFVTPPLTAGMFAAVARRIDGGRADVDALFEGFRQRFWPSVVANLVIVGVVLGMLVLLGAVIGVLVAVGAVTADSFRGPEPPVVLIAALIVIGIPMLLAIAIVSLFFAFTFLAIWDYPDSGLEAVKASVQLVNENFWSVLGYALLGGLISLGAYVAGALACCVGVFFTVPAAAVWLTAATIYLYRSWTGQPLVQPRATGQGPTPGGPVPPVRFVT